MAWENTLLPASFRGILFEVVSTGDDIERAIVSHEYPYVDGANVEDMGRAARRISMTAVFYGDDYEIQLQQFLGAIDTPGAAELIHPIFGSINAQFVRTSIPHEAMLPDQTRITLEFVESALRSVLFDRVLPLQQVEAVNEAADNALAAAQSRFASDIGGALNLPALLRDQLSADMLGVMDTMRGYCDQLIEARGWLASGVYYLNNPIAFVDDLTGGLISRLKALLTPIDLRVGYSGADDAAGITSGYTRGGLETVWKAPIAHMQQPLLIPSQAASGQPPQAFLSAHIEVQLAIAIAGCSAQLFGKGLADAVMTPADIETIAADTRVVINSAIARVRATFPDIVASRPLTESLKALALTVTDAAEKLISARPPLVDRIVDTPGNLQLLAHLWYGDYHRADELLRLNPLVKNPNFIANGATLRAYAA
ncbi:MAG: DNA circularization N-terminal domain-containing protein [Oxalobacteraceae bacterium]|nr:DNA circularization N-terminal domain-containing protein [Oxalobacteraceae bacterium]